MSDEKKLKVSLILLIVSLVAFVVAITSFASMISGKMSFGLGLGLGAPCAIIYQVSILVSAVLNLTYRKDNVVPGTLSTVMLVITCIMFLPLVLFVLFMAFAGGENDSGYSEPKDITAKDDKGNEHTLTPTWEDGIVMKKQYYNDQKGDEWISQDGGQTFAPVIKKVKGEDGKEYTLKPQYAGSTEYYEDQNGDVWVTYDEGKTFERWLK